MKEKGENLKELPRFPYGQGSMSYTSDGRIMFRKPIGNPKRSACVYGKTPRECMEKMAEKEKMLEHQKKIPNTRTLYEEMSAWLINQKKIALKPQAYRRLEGTVNNQIKNSDIGNLRYMSLTCDDIQAVINKLDKEHYSYSTIKKTYDALNAFYRFVSARDKIDNPMLLVVKPTENSVSAEAKDIEWFEQDDINKFVSACSACYATGTPRFPYGRVLAANIYLGCRAGELLCLTWRDIDFEAGTIYISKTLIEAENPKYEKNNPELMKEKGIKRTLFVVQKNTKTDRNRFVPMNNKAKELLLAHRAISKFTDPDDYVILTRNRKTTTIKNLSNSIAAIERFAGTTVQSCNTHILRHTCASLYFRKDVAVETIAQILGNSVEVCRKTYIHFIDEQLKEAASRIDGLDVADEEYQTAPKVLLDSSVVEAALKIDD